MAEKIEKSGEELKKGKWKPSTFESRTEAQARELLEASGLEVPSMAEGVKRKVAKGKLPSTFEAAAARYAEKYGANPKSEEIAGVEEKKLNPGNPEEFKSLREIKELTKPVVGPASTEIKAEIVEEPKEKKFERIIPAEGVTRRKAEEAPKREPFKIIPAAEVESKIPQRETPEGVTPDMESKLLPLREPGPAELRALRKLTPWEKEVILERDGPEPVERPREISKTEAEDEARRKFFQITLNRPDFKYSDSEAANPDEADKKLLKAAREKWVFAIHGQEQMTEDGLKIKEFPDLDSAAALFLYKEAGFKKAAELKYLKKGEYLVGAMNIDTGGEIGMVLLPGKGTEEEGATAIGDHHAKKMEYARRDLSAAKVHYEFLVKAGALRRSEKYDRLVDFVTFIDNKNYLDDPKYDDYFKHYFENSWQTLIGLRNYLQPHLLARFIKSEKDYNRILSDEELRQLRLIYTKREKASEEPAGDKKAEVKNGEAEKGKEINYAERLKKAVEKSKQELERMQQEGFFVDSARYGKIAVDIGKQVPGGVEAARAFGCGAYVRWTPEANTFLINTIKPLKESFSQGIGRHGRMWLKPFLDESPLNLKLEEILSKLTDGKFEPTLKLKEFIEKEQKEMETKQIMETAKAEVFVSAAREFYQQLKAEAEKSILSWGKYSPEDQRTLLEMEVKTFLRELMEEYGIKGAKAEDYLINEIRKGLTVPAENSSTEKTPVIEALKKEVKEVGVEKPRAIEKEQKFPPEVEKNLKEISELYKKYMSFSGFDRLLPDGEAQKVEKLFHEKFRPFRMGVANAMERRRSENPPPPDFQKENDGSYYFIELSKTFNFFIVVPRPETVLLESAYGPGAMGEVFEAPGFDSRKLYDIMEVARPAIFKKDEQGKFQLIEKGEISLKER